MKSLFATLCLYLLFLTNIAQAKDSDSAYDHVIAKNEIVCGLVPWAPFKEYDPNSKEWKGFAVDIYRQAFATLDIKVTFQEVVLGNQVQDLNSGRIDAMCDDGPWTLSSGKYEEYSSPVYYSAVYPYVRVTEKRFQTVTDLDTPTVTFSGIDGDLSNDLVGRFFPKAKLASMPATTDVSQLYLNVATGKADVVIADPSSFSTFDKHNPHQIKPLKTKPLVVYKQVIAVKKGDTKMLGLVNEAVDNALAFGIVDRILDGYDPTHEKLMRVAPRYTK